MNKHELIPVASILPNPHRDFTRNPVRKDQVAKILDSISRTGFWDNVVVRRHPVESGKYQLAYGHNRIQAVIEAGITEVRLPVANLSDWDMYCAMVDENESQQMVTPAIAFENVEVGVRILEGALQAIGPKGTEQQLWAKVGRVVPVGTTQSKLRKPGQHEGNGFEQVRNAFFGGEGLGRVWLTEVLPCGKLRDATISEVLNSHYGRQREEAKRKQVEAKRKESEAKAKKAQAQEDEAEAERLRRESEEAAKEADKLAREAKRIGARSIVPEILLCFDTPNQMTSFAAAIKAAGVDKDHHEAAMEFVKKEDVSAGKMTERISQWWYDVSGQRERDWAKTQKEEAFKEFQRRVKGGNFGDFLVSMGRKIEDLRNDIKLALDAARYYENQKHREAIANKCIALRGELVPLIDALAGDPNEEDYPERTNGRVQSQMASLSDN